MLSFFLQHYILEDHVLQVVVVYFHCFIIVLQMHIPHLMYLTKFEFFMF